MAVASVDFFIDNLKQLLEDNKDHIPGLKDDTDSLLVDLKSLKAFLKQAAKSRSENEIVKDMVKQMRITINEAEDCIEKFVIDTKLHQNKMITKLFDTSSAKRTREAATEIRSIKEKLRDIRRNSAYGFQTFQLDEPHSRYRLQEV